MLQTERAVAFTALPLKREHINQTVAQRFEQVVARFGSRVALVGNGRHWTYEELNCRVNQIAHAIRSTSPTGDGCVAFLAPHSPEMVITALAILKAGKPYLAIHPRLPAQAQREIIEDAVPDLIVTTACLAAQAHKVCDSICDTLRLDQIEDRGSDENPSLINSAWNPSAIFYTSGTTGRPKGVVKSHRTQLHRAWLAGQHDSITPEDRLSLLTSCSFASSEADMLGALLHGATLCVFDVTTHGMDQFREWLEQMRITLLHPPVLYFRRFLATLRGENLFPSVRQVTLAGDVVLPADIDKWRQHFTHSCSLLQRFSTTEAAVLTIARTGALGSHGQNGRFVGDQASMTAGFPVEDKYLDVIDTNGRSVGPGDTGQLVVKSDFLADGYWRRPAETAAAFQADPETLGRRVYRTGDLGHFLPDGRFVFEGRRDHQVKIRGFRLDLREVEAAILSLEPVGEVAAVVWQSADEQKLAAFVVLKAGAPIDASAIRDLLGDSLPEWKIPSRIISIPSLPTTPSEKIDRQVLVGLLRESTCHASPCSGAKPTIEGELALIWMMVLKADDVDYDARFIDLGGDSISAAMALNRIEQRFGIRWQPNDLLRNGSINELAKRIREEGSIE